MRHEEIFGPVAPVATFETEDEAVAAANDTEYGLVAYVFTRDLDRAFRVCERLETGMIGLNQGVVSNPAAPFGGVKQSGLGPRGRPRRDRGVPRDQVRRDRHDGLSGAMATTTTSRRIALIPGDGIGAEVAASARAVLAALDARHDLGLQHRRVRLVLRALPGGRAP